MPGETGALLMSLALSQEHGTLRPDDVLIDEESPIRCFVQERAFRGADTMYTIGMNSDCELLSLMPSRFDFNVGDEVGIEIDIDHLVLFRRQT